MRETFESDETALLNGYTVLELAGRGGQMSGKILADLGATVIKVEAIEGDEGRLSRPLYDSTSIPFAYLNSAKLSISIDINHTRAAEILDLLMKQSDVLLHAPVDGRGATVRLDLELLHERHPHLVIVSITPFGRTGPYSDFVAPDIVSFAMGGLMSVSGSPNMPPVNAPETQSHYFSSIFAAQGALMALLRRDSGFGSGGIVDVSAQQALASIEQLIRIFSAERRVIQRTGSQHKHVSPGRIYPTRDGFVSLFVTDHHWKAFLSVWPDHPQELESHDLLRADQRMAHLETIDGAVRRFTTEYTTAEFVSRMYTAGVPCTPVNTLKEFLADEQTVYRQVLMDVQHPGFPLAQQVGFPALINGKRPPVLPAPTLGEHTRSILTGYLDFSDEDVDVLVGGGVVRE